MCLGPDYLKQTAKSFLTSIMLFMFLAKENNLVHSFTSKCKESLLPKVIISKSTSKLLVLIKQSTLNLC